MHNNSSPGDVLKEFWSYDEFRPLQREIIESVLNGNDTFALLPTGGGKSICYQVPALCQEGICLVVSPLISLMQDQVDDLNARNIKALSINSHMSIRDIDRSLDNAVFGNYKLLYVSPERLKTDIFIERFKRMNVNFIAVDEAHCISQWGYDFRPSYLEINKLREIHDVPILALTATATKEVVEDIVANLELKSVRQFRKSFSRENIQFTVKKTENKLKWAVDLIGKYHGSGIIYVRNRRKCKEIAEILNHQGISASYYHAGLGHIQRNKVQNDWMQNNVRVIVATNAFGMGIDKADVRFVIHWSVPDSLEAYYQEAGRAGRDGKESESLVLYSDFDISHLHENLDKAYPPIKDILASYNHLGNYFQIAEGGGFMHANSFDLSEFSERFNIDKTSAYNCLKQLEMEGLIALSTGFSSPTMVQVLGDKTDILSFREQNPAYNELIGFLLRAYGGILEDEIKVDEEEIARKTNLSVKEVNKKLIYLEKLQLIKLDQRSNLPSITYLSDRLQINNVHISTEEYFKRKEGQEKRVKAVISYARSNDKCRSELILDYFDDDLISKFCGHCDYCKTNANLSSNNKSTDLNALILTILEDNSLTLEELEKSIPSFSFQDIEKSCRKLCEMELLRLESNNRFTKK